MNLLILEQDEPGILIPRSDRRFAHVRKVLRKGPGDRIEAGLATDSPFGPAPGSVGLARIAALDEAGMVLDYEPAAEAPPLAALRLVLGFPRPIQANRIFKDLASLGIARIELTGTELGEKSYLESSFFKSREYRGPLLEGAEQAANPRLPTIGQHWTLRRCLEALDPGRPGSGAESSADGSAEGRAEGRAEGSTEGRAAADGEAPDWKGGLFVALHPQPDAPDLGAYLASSYRQLSASFAALPGRPVTLAIGSERGWTPVEVELLRASGFALCALGSRILKTETAAIAASALCLAAMGRM